MTLVMKFGGTSVGSAEAMVRTAGLIRQSIAAGQQVVVVCSGMGSRPVKVTDLLLQGAHAALNGEREITENVARQLRDIHFKAIDALLQDEVVHLAVRADIEQFISRFEDLCAAVLVLGELTPRALDAISAMGEQMSVRILAAYLQVVGQPAEVVDATDIVVTDGNFQNASPLWSETTLRTRKRLLPLLEAGVLPVVTGFIGATQEGVTTTLGRGGSDFSAAIMGQALGVEEVWIWTDVDGVMSADPRLVAQARNIPELSFREVAELAFYGAKVLHPKTIRPCVEVGIPLRIKNTFSPEHPGTVILRRSKANNGGMKAVTAITDLSLITVEGRGMMGVPGIAARTFGTAAAKDVSVLLITQASSEQSICFAARDETTEKVIAGLEQEFEKELDRRDIDRVWAMRPVSIITVVGAGMRGTPGIAGRLFTALGNQHINIIAIAQGSSECSISLVVAGRDTAEAVRQIHALL